MIVCIFESNSSFNVVFRAWNLIGFGDFEPILTDFLHCRRAVRQPPDQLAQTHRPLFALWVPPIRLLLYSILSNLPVLVMLRRSSRKPCIAPEPWGSRPISWPRQTGRSLLSGSRPSVGTNIASDVVPSFCVRRKPICQEIWLSACS